ncbi:MAG: D-alanine--D-alanine ligase family protein [Gemmatimonadaceae bacterium]
MKIALLFDGVSALGAAADVLILETVEAIEDVLQLEGNQVVRIPVNPDGRWVERLRRGKLDLAFNLCEGIDGVAAAEPAVIAVLELLEIPFTGSSSWTTGLCLRKHLVNAMLDRASLPIPNFALVRRGAALRSVGFPAICKPAAEDASVGVEQRSVVRSMRALAARLSAMHERWDEVIVQRYIDGREVNVGILGEEVLPIAEIQFGAMPKGMWRIVSYRSKWEAGSDEDAGAIPECPAALPPKLAAELRRIAVSAWRAVGGEGYGRVDFRIDNTGRPWLLEVNANPDIAPVAGLARMARVAGMDYGALVRTVCQLALTRERVIPDDAWFAARALSGIPADTHSAALDLFVVGER